MAGICGFVSFEKHLPGEQAIRLAAAAIQRRGGLPRSQQFNSTTLLIGSGKLKNQTLQPISNASATTWVVLDGFLTNDVSLRAELSSSGKGSAAESHAHTVAALYDQFGDDIADRLEGSFTAAIWDTRAFRLLVVRDRFGARPLFWHSSPVGLAFASSILALCALGVPADVNLQSVDDYLSLGYIPAPASIYRGVQKLPAAHALRATPGGEVRVQRYWDILDHLGNPPRPPNGDSRDWQKKIWSTLAHSVEKFSIGEDRVGAFLSGGPDSAALVAALHEIGRDQSPTFTIGFRDPDFDEAPSARLTVERYAAPHHELSLDERDGQKLLECVDAFDEPYAHPSSVPIYLLSQLAAQHVDVAMGGDAADSLFGGASTYRASNLLASFRKLPRFLRSGLLPWVVEQLPVTHARSSFRYLARRFVSASEMTHQHAHLAWMEVLSTDLKARLYGPLLNEATLQPPFRIYREMFDRCPHLDRLNQLMYVDLNLFLAEDILTKVDRLSAIHHLEVRTPFLDRELAEFSFRLPHEVKVRGSQRKYLFRQSLRGKIPEPILEQGKIAFISPASQWLCGGMRELLQDTLSSNVLRRSGFVQPQAVALLLQEHLSMKRDHGRALWSLLSFFLWLSRNHEANQAQSWRHVWRSLGRYNPAVSLISLSWLQALEPSL